MRNELKVLGDLKKNIQIPGRIYRAKLAEPYDGIGQYVLVNLTGASTSSALRTRIAVGDFGGRRKFPRGTPVTVTVRHGQLETFLGNGGPSPCRKYFLCCPEIPEDIGCNAFNGAEVSSPNQYEAFSEVQGNTIDKIVNGHCGLQFSGKAWPAGAGSLQTNDLIFTKTRKVQAIFSSENIPGNAQYIIDKDDSTYWQSSVLGKWVGVDLGTPRAITQFRLLQGADIPVEAGGSPSSTETWANNWTIEASVDGGINWFQVHQSIGNAGPEIAGPLRSGTVVARHWRVVKQDGTVQGYPWAVYAFELKDLSGKNWALVEHSPATVYDQRKANWIYLMQTSANLVASMTVYTDTGNGLELRVSGLVAEYAQVISNKPGCATSTATLSVGVSKFRLPSTLISHSWRIQFEKPGGFNPLIRINELLGFYIPE